MSFLAGWYGVPEGLVFSFPVQVSRTGDYNVVEDFELTPEFEQQLLPIITVKIFWVVLEHY